MKRKMACQAVQLWSLSGLIAAFLDLAIAYILLCASAFAYFVSKFVGFLGLSLPCPCDGLFFPNKNLCLNRLLIDSPTQIVSDVQFSVKQKFPFNGSIGPNNFNYSNYGSNSVNGVFEIDGEDASCSSVSNERMVEMKGKRVVGHRPRSGRVRKRARDHGECSLVLSRSSTNTGGNELAVDGEIDAHHLEYNQKSPTLRELRQRPHTTVQTNYYSEQDTHANKDTPSNDDPKYSPKAVKSLSEDEKNAIKILEEALEEEQIARAALFLDLEKERSAAASAADEAMAMILRLQEEKASLEMEARQYERIFEAKSAYDAEEMNILTEILVRRETEINFLEKEVDAYEKMLSGENEVSVDPNDDPIQILHQLIADNDKKDERSKLQKQGDSNEQLQEKEMISVDSNTSKEPQDNKSLVEGKTLEQTKEINLGAEKIIETSNQSDLVDMKRSSSEIFSRLPPKGPRGSRRNSMSALDSEMSRIGNEVGRLRERLKLVQEGREKLSSITLENRERENIQFKLLEDIARQVQEIRHLTVPGKALRQVSLPVPTSKGLSKKRRCRSVSSGYRP